MAAHNALVEQLADYSSVLTGSSLAQFLATKSWTVQQELPWEQVWVNPEVTRRGAPMYLHIPREKSLDDYQLRVAQAVEAIGDVYGWTLPTTAEHVSSVRADLFFVRLDQSATDGTIPLRQASELLESIDSMVRTAAITAHNPKGTGKGRVPDYVREFLAEDVRMGHTKRGSFIITVAARLENQDDQPLTQSSVSTPQHSESQPSYHYTRRVMTTLSRGLAATQRYVATDGQSPNLEEAVECGMRLPLVKALRTAGTGEAYGV